MRKAIYTNGREEEIESREFEKLQEIVGGYVEFINLPDGTKMAVNEDGLLEKLPVNNTAMEYLSNYGELAQQIVGNVVIIDERRKR